MNDGGDGPRDHNLAMASYGDLLQRIDELRSRAQTTQSSWDLLRGLAEELRGSDAGEFDPTNGDPWSLSRIEVRGYRGIAGDAPLAIEFDPSPGITVLHGPNGSGKSSLSDAIETVLHGAPGGSAPIPDGRGGNTPVWEPVHVARSADEATITVCLARPGERLVITCIVRDDEVVDRTFELARGEEVETVVPGPAWTSAVASYLPVFAYASWERRIQVSRHLKNYLEGLLALGGCFTALEAAVQRRRSASEDAYQRWKSAVADAQREVGDVDAAHSRGEPSDLPDLEWPEVSEDVDRWLDQNGLSVSAGGLRAVSGTERDELREASTTALEAVRDEREASRTVREQLADQVLALAEASERLENPGEECPVCATSPVTWLARLRSVAGELNEEGRDHARAVRQALEALTERLRDVAPAVLALQDGCPSELAPTMDEFSVRATSVLEAVRLYGTGAGAEQPKTAAVAFAEWIDDAAASRLFDYCIEQTEHLRLWAAARADAVSSFIETWRREADTARDHAAWRDTSSRVDDLRKELKKERTESLKVETSRQLERLLSDVGVAVGEIKVQKTQASLSLTGRDGATLELGMLSAGQRNALLLAPLLAVADAGPFAFLVLDDPVHAFDELRIDQLAHALEALASTRRVIVLTHDARLREHLLARPVASEARDVSRDPLASRVTIRDDVAMWKALLDDAETLLKTSDGVTGTSLSVIKAVRGLCRQAVDDALRTFVIRNAVMRDRDVAADLKRLESDGFHTRARFGNARTIAAQCPPAVQDRINDAQGECAPHLDAWNRASHGNPEEAPADATEVAAARAACQRLTER